MDIFFIICAGVCFTAAVILFRIQKTKKSTIAGNIAFVMIIISFLSIGCYSLDVDTLFQKEHSSEFSQPTTSAVTTERNNGRPVKKDNQTTEPQALADSDTVYITRNGEKYHFSYTCSNNQYYECTIDQALARGLTPCKKCAQ